MHTGSERLGLNITTRDVYILVEPSKGINFLEVLHGLAKLLSMPEFQNRNDIWVFRDGKMDITYADLYKIKEYVIKNFPRTSHVRKTAIVVETGLQKSLVELYAKMEEELPHEIRIFSDLKSAEEWIRETGS